MLERLRRLFRRGAPPPEAGESSEKIPEEIPEEIPEDSPEESENANFVLRLLIKHQLSGDSCQLFYEAANEDIITNSVAVFFRYSLLRKAGFFDKRFQDMTISDWRRCVKLAN